MLFFFWRHTQQAAQKQFGTLHTNSRIPHETTALKLLKPNYKHSYSKLAMCGAGKKKKNNSELQETKTGEWWVLKRSCTCPTNCGSESLRFCLRCGQEIRIVIKETFASPHKKPLTAKNLFRLPDFRLSVCTKVATVPVCNRSRYYTSNNFFFF